MLLWRALVEGRNEMFYCDYQIILYLHGNVPNLKGECMRACVHARVCACMLMGTGACVRAYACVKS